jgi:hypothetical protein
MAGFFMRGRMAGMDPQLQQIIKLQTESATQKISLADQVQPAPIADSYHGDLLRTGSCGLLRTYNAAYGAAVVVAPATAHAFRARPRQ